jgi:curved DNA-binding protein CbpA
MAQIHTHYDNLKVARNAPPEVIRAAYRTLSQKFHPDRNPGNAEAARIMAIINTSYEVLSDPNKRQEHDLWVAQQERPSAQPPKPNSQPQPTQRQTPNSPPKLKAASGGVFAHILRNWLGYGVVAFFIWIWATDKPRTPPPGPKPYQAVSAPPVRPQYVRPNAAPNGQPWPASAAYVKG